MTNQAHNIDLTLPASLDRKTNGVKPLTPGKPSPKKGKLTTPPAVQAVIDARAKESKAKKTPQVAALPGMTPLGIRPALSNIPSTPSGRKPAPVELPADVKITVAPAGKTAKQIEAAAKKPTKEALTAVSKKLKAKAEKPAKEPKAKRAGTRSEGGMAAVEKLVMRAKGADRKEMEAATGWKRCGWNTVLKGIAKRTGTQLVIDNESRPFRYKLVK